MAIGETIRRPASNRNDVPASNAHFGSRLTGWLFQPVPIDPLIYFRIGFGAIMLWEVWRYFTAGWISLHYIEPAFHFTYFGFEWVRPWGGNGMYYHFAVLGLCAACLLTGFCYRLAATVFWLGFTYFFLLDQANYLNHFYLVSLVSFAMIFVPAGRACSLDVWLRPQLARTTAPRWTLWLIVAHVGIAYFFGGIAKFNWDWLTGNPMRMMLASAQDFPLVGRFFLNESVVLLFAYSGLLLDLFIMPLLIWKRTRVPALVAATVFHLSNDMLFSIGIFPWFMLYSTLVFFPPVQLTPLRLLRMLAGVVYVYAFLRMLNSDWRDHETAQYVMFCAGIGLLPLMIWSKTRLAAFGLACAMQLAFGFGLASDWGIRNGIHPLFLVLAGFIVFPPRWLSEWRIVSEMSPDDGPPEPAQARTLVVAGLAIYFGIQILLPFRHWLYPGSVHWTEEGHLFAWHMKLRYKTGYTSFIAYGRDGQPLPQLGAGGYLLFATDESGHRSAVLNAQGKAVYGIRRETRTEFVQAAPESGWLEVDDRDVKLYEIDARGLRSFSLDGLGRRLHSISVRDNHIYVVDGRDPETILFEMNADGSRNIAFDDEQRPVYELDAFGSPIYELDEAGARLFALNADGERVIPREGGRPLPKLQELARTRPVPGLPFLLTTRQRSKASGRPDMILQYAHFAGRCLREQGVDVESVRTISLVSLNAREFQTLIDPDVNLLEQPRSLAAKAWIVPLDPKLVPGIRLLRAQQEGQLDEFTD